eukprot:8736680-Pyramimonas_sp.AAC.1
MRLWTATSKPNFKSKNATYVDRPIILSEFIREHEGQGERDWVRYSPDLGFPAELFYVAEAPPHPQGAHKLRE